ncbi:MAG: TetR/AcrR family transcriptional regulator [Alphaproteobacteria bacterium]|nr:TetR/AcrR family transcriptional regulator [Alphaproteobacteria bacterium]
MDARTYLAKATPKSQRTRARILEAAMRLFAEVGYHAATNALIADAAKLTRGAMLYHFATREELVVAAVGYIELERAKLFEQAAAQPPAPGVDAAEHAIDAYWGLLHEAPFVAFAELEAAARTDEMLRAALAEAQSAFDRAQVGARFGAIIQAGADPRFQTSRDLGRFVLEGLAKGSMTYDELARRERLIAVVKRAVRILNRKGDAQELWSE